MDATTDGANVRFPPPLVYVGGLVVGIAAGRFLDLPGLGLQPVVRSLVGGAIVVVGFLVSFAGAGLFLRRGTAIIPYKPVSHLVTSGIYRWTRNPMYLGMALVYTGLALVFDSLAALFLLPVVLLIIQSQVISKEEAYLERAFGGQYVSYKKSVRRWI